MHTRVAQACRELAKGPERRLSAWVNGPGGTWEWAPAKEIPGKDWAWASRLHPCAASRAMTFA